MRAKILDAKKGALPHLRTLVRQALVKEWQQILRLQVGVEVWPLAHHVGAAAPVRAARTHAAIGLIRSVRKRVIPLRCHALVTFILPSVACHHELCLLYGLLMLQLLRLLVQNIKSNKRCLPDTGI